MTASGYARGSETGVTAKLSASVRHTLAAALLLLGLADLAAIDFVLLPRYLAKTASIRSVSPESPPMGVATTSEVAPAPHETSPAAAEAASHPEPVHPPPATPTPAEPVAVHPHEFPHLLFASGVSRPPLEAKEILGRVLAILAENPSLRVVISGYADSLGAEDTNHALSRSRARRCGRWLERRGVNPARMEIQGFGSTRPVTDDRSPEAQARNRRVEFELR